MEAKWLEDFVALAESGNFSKSALLRNVTQPAFSRRIQSLEAWAGVALIDRTSYPTRLTKAGEVFYEQAVAMLAQLNTSRALLRGQGKVSKETVEFAVPHTLSFVFVPKWLSGLERRLGPIRSRLLAGNVHDAVLALVEGACDLLICYHHPHLPVQLDAQRFEMKALSNENVAAFSRADRQGLPVFNLPGAANSPVPYLAYSSNAYLGRVSDLIRRQSKERLHLDNVYETDMAEGLKMMALEGRGVAWLPESLVVREAKAKQLVRLNDKWSEPVQIRIYRHRPSEGARPKAVAERLWDALT